MDSIQNAILLDRYARDGEETTEDVFRRVAGDIGQTVQEQSDFYDAMCEGRFIPAGRILAGNTGRTYFNCFVVPQPHDSREGITETLTQMINIMAMGGGVGINLSSLRPQGTEAKGVGGESSGAVSWGGLYSYATGLVIQGGNRRGALMLIVDDWHPDVLEFIHSKREAGKITNANISVFISDAFMEAVERDDVWRFVFPDTSFPGYDDLWNGDLQEWKRANRPVIQHGEIRAKDMWNQICESAWASGEPGALFVDRAREMSTSQYFSNLISTNPCFTGDTRVYTDKGIFTAEELCLSQVPVQAVIDGRFGIEDTSVLASRVFKTGTKPVYKVSTKQGYEIRVTANHKIMTPSGWVEAKDLVPGDRVHVLNREGGFGYEGDEEFGQLLGWVAGDGCISNGTVSMDFFGEKIELLEKFTGIVNRIAAINPVRPGDWESKPAKHKKRGYYRLASRRLDRVFREHGMSGDKFDVPEIVFRGTRNMQSGYISALFSADGGVTYRSKGEKHGVMRRVSLKSSKLKLLKSVQLLLQNFGIYSSIRPARKERTLQEFPRGGVYWSNPSWTLSFGGTNLVKFCDKIGFMIERKQSLLEEAINSYTRGTNAAKPYVEVESVSPDGVEDVYDVNVPTTHSLIANGIVIHNCSEIYLGAWGVCCLGHVCLQNMVKEDIEGNVSVDWVSIKNTVKTGVRFLDNVIDITPYRYAENERVQKGERRIGLGTMGFGELLIKLGIRYGSDESVELAEKIQKMVTFTAYEQSSDIALEKGSFPEFDTKKFLASGFCRKLPDHLRAKIREDGMRNVACVTQAPTGTVGTLMSTSTGIEPFFSFVNYRKSRLGVFEERHPILNGVDELQDYHVTAMEGVSVDDHVRVLCAFSNWNDQSVSKTVNLPSNATVEDIASVYEYVYKNGAKGCAIYRDGSRNEQVLFKPSACNECGEEAVITENDCSTCQSCGWSVCST